MILPRETRKLGPWALNIIDACRASVGARAALARSLKQWTYTGSPDGNTAILNMMYPHLDRASKMLFSPNDLRFHMEFTHSYPKEILDQAEIASRTLTRVWSQRDIDMKFSQAVFLALQFGSCFPKLLDAEDGMNCKLVMPWQIGVYREDQPDFIDQEAICETSYITPFDLWRRVSHLPNAAELFKRAVSYAKRAGAEQGGESFFHQVLIAGTPPVVQTDPPFMQQPGGLVQVTADPVGAIIAPDVAAELICFHELWVWDDEREDYTTIQMCEPDILIAPLYRRRNMFVTGHIPYTKVQPNWMEGYFFGRSE